MTFPYTCSIEPLSFHSLCKGEQMGRQVTQYAAAAESSRGLAPCPGCGMHISQEGIC